MTFSDVLPLASLCGHTHGLVQLSAALWGGGMLHVRDRSSDRTGLAQPPRARSGRTRLPLTAWPRCSPMLWSDPVSKDTTPLLNPLPCDPSETWGKLRLRLGARPLTRSELRLTEPGSRAISRVASSHLQSDIWAHQAVPPNTSCPEARPGHSVHTGGCSLPHRLQDTWSHRPPPTQKRSRTPTFHLGPRLVILR